MFDHFPHYPGDPIFSLNTACENDPRPHKVNLGIGIYQDEDGHVPRLATVRQAELALRGQEGPSLYQPMAGAENYRRATRELLFGSDDSRVATIQTIGGSGALRIGGDLLRRQFTGSAIWVSEPSWSNHAAIFSACGFRVQRYPYYDAATRGVDFDAMRTCLAGLPPQAIVVLHPCCHNPTGADLTHAQWDAVIAIVRERQLLAFFDLAYQGFGAGIDDDAYALRAMTAAGVSFLVANSYSKNFSLYGERCGALSMVCGTPAAAQRALGQMELAVRSSYSSPPRHGGQLVAQVLLTPALRTAWEAEAAQMRERIQAMRGALHDALRARRPDVDAGYLLRQRGMFSYTGFSASQVAALRENAGVYLIDSGRMCMAALTAHNVERVASAFARIMR